MNMRFAPKAAATAALALVAAVGAQNCADQRAPECTTGFTVSNQAGTVRAGYATRLELLSQSGMCNPGEILKGGVFGIRTYYQGGSDGYIDYSIPAKVALQFEPVGLAAFEAYDREAPGFDRLDPNLILYNIGDFATATPNGDRCDVVNIQPVNVQIPEAPLIPADEGDPEDPDDDEPEQPAVPPISYAINWTRLQFLVTTPYPGTQFEGDVTIQVNNCIGTYKATGVYATDHVSCAGAEGGPDPSQCLALPDLSQGVFFGTGINPDFPVRCEDVTPEGVTDPAKADFLCVLDGDFPAIR